VIGCWGVDRDPCTIAPGATAAWLLDIGVCFSHSAVLILDKIWPSPSSVKWDNIDSVFWFSSCSLARSPVGPSALCVWKTRLPFTCVCVKARGGESNIAISAAAIPLPFSTIRSLQSFQGSFSSVWFDFLKILYVLDNNVRRQFSFMCWLVFSGKDVSVADVLQRFLVRPLPFSPSGSLPRFERSFV